MPRKATTSKTSKTDFSESVKQSEKMPKVKANVKETKVVKEEPVEDLDISDVESVETSVKTKRRVPSKESVLEGFDDLVAVIDDEILRVREGTGKTKGVKFLKSICKSVKSLRNQSVRAMKQKQKTSRGNSTNSGFLKPVHISKDMAKFTGWDSTELKSRVDVTKYICNYIKENNLQNPTDRRQIIPDKKLAKLLDYNSDKEEKPLTYYRIQSYMKKHFIDPKVEK